MIRDLIQSHVSQAIERLKSSGALPADLSAPLEIADPKEPAHGDFATSWALAASRAAGMNPRELAEALRGELEFTSPLEGEVGEPANRERGALPDPSPQFPSVTDPLPQGEREVAASLFSAIEVAGPGFLNFRLTDAAWLHGLTWANAHGGDLAKPSATRHSPFATRHLNVEFVSVNPNGPITVGSGRGAAFGSTLCNVLEAVGHSVHREYYINDGTNSEQMRAFAESVRAICLGLPVPDNGYKGDYVADCAKSLMAHLSDGFLSTLVAGFETEDFAYGGGSVEATQFLSKAKTKLFQKLLNRVRSGESQLDIVASMSSSEIQSLIEFEMTTSQGISLEEFGVQFNTWFSEQSLHDSGKVAEAIAHLESNGAADEKPERRNLKLAKGGVIEDVIVEEQPVEDEEEHGNVESPTADGQRLTANDPKTANPTLWLRSTKFGDDMDRVLRRKDGRLTYISSDVAYHQDKFKRGSKPDADGKTEKADKLITILGPDHHGYIARLHAVLAATEVRASDIGRGTNGTDGTDGTSEPDLSNLTNPSDSQPPTANRQALTHIDAQLYSSPEERDACQAALKKAREELEVLIFQIVRFVKEGKPAPMRKRDGNIYSLRDLMAEIGKDAAPNAPQEEQMRIGKDVARFFYLMRSHDTHMDFDIDLATKGTDENPVFYVQYAHARICSILEKAGLEGKNEERKAKSEVSETVIDDSEMAHGLRPAANESGTANRQSAIPPEGSRRPGPPTANLHPKEALLIKKILDLPDEVARCAQDYGVHRLTTYAVELARTFHHFYDACRVIQPENPELQTRRIAICEATRHALRGALELLGISAPNAWSGKRRPKNCKEKRR